MRALCWPQDPPCRSQRNQVDGTLLYLRQSVLTARTTFQLTLSGRPPLRLPLAPSPFTFSTSVSVFLYPDRGSVHSNLGTSAAWSMHVPRVYAGAGYSQGTYTRTQTCTISDGHVGKALTYIHPHRRVRGARASVS